MEREPIQPEEHEGERYLNLIDMGHLADEDIVTASGTSLKARDFLDFCREHALPRFQILENMSQDDPLYEQTKTDLQTFVNVFVESYRPQN